MTMNTILDFLLSYTLKNHRCFTAKRERVKTPSFRGKKNDGDQNITGDHRNDLGVDQSI